MPQKFFSLEAKERKEAAFVGLYYCFKSLCTGPFVVIGVTLHQRVFSDV
jgi:hypothetical protein